jgi:hypothetical protein
MGEIINQREGKMSAKAVSKIGIWRRIREAGISMA